MTLFLMFFSFFIFLNFIGIFLLKTLQRHIVAYCLYGLLYYCCMNILPTCRLQGLNSFDIKCLCTNKKTRMGRDDDEMNEINTNERTCVYEDTYVKQEC